MDNLNNTWGLPVIYKTLSIYPVKMKDCDIFYNSINCLLIEKNKSQDIQILKMSYLYFLFYIGMNATDESGYKFSYLIDNLKDILSLVFQEDKIMWKSDNNRIFIVIKNIELNEQDFDNIKKIILSQNLIKYSENILDAELEQKIKEAEEFLAQRNNDNATLEENIFAFAASMNKFPDEIKELTIYQFKKILERKNLLKTWEVYLYPALKGGEQDKIKHWLSHIPEQGMYDHVIMSMDEFNKITSDSGIFNKA